MSLTCRRSSRSSRSSKPSKPSSIDSAAASEADLMRSAVSGSVSRRDLIRRGRRAGLGLAAVAALAMMPRQGSARKVAPGGSGVGPNCIYVCCNGGSDCLFTDEPMCLRCFDKR